MSVRSGCALLGALLFLFPAICSPAWAAERLAEADQEAKAKPEASCAELVRSALLAEAAGRAQRREQLLQQAIVKDPDFAPARWQTGYLRQGDRWLSLEKVQREASQDKRLADYRKLRDELVSDPQADGKLARWCRDHGLRAEARVHWARVLAAQPQNAEAVNALGQAWHQGQLLSEEQIEQWRKAQSKTRRGHSPLSKQEKDWIDYWEPRLADWRRSVQGDAAVFPASMRAELDGVQEPLAVHVLNTLLMNRSQFPQDRKAYHTLSLGLIQYLEYCEEPWAVPQLVRQAVDHPVAELRKASIAALKKRPQETSVPWLLERMRFPIQGAYAIASGGPGGIACSYSLEVERPEVVLLSTVEKSIGVREGPGIGPATRAGAFVARSGAARESQKAHLQAMRDAVRAKQRVEAANAQAAEVNQRVTEVLAACTGTDLKADPLVWHQWWKDFCLSYYEIEETHDTYSGEEGDTQRAKPVCEQQSYQTVTRYFRRVSCFSWNTKVWTLTGPTNIDQIRPGDRVLAQHPRTGELTYKPVLEVTKRKPSPMMKIGAGKDTILTTRGHPFWVCGQGWKMAKQLESGMRLHTVCGPVAIDRVEQAPAAGPWYEQLKDRPDAKPEDVLSYNLVVDEFHDYFVGEGKLLVHDNMLFPLDGPVPPVPGLASRR